MTSQRLGLKDKILLAALECSRGDPSRRFTGEELLVAAWKQDPYAWGLRGFETEHPDLERLRKEIDSRGKATGSQSLVNNGFLAKYDGRIYSLTAKGLAAAARFRSSDGGTDDTVQAKVGRVLHSKIKAILDNPVFSAWQKDHSHPKLFRDAGYFWGIAPGTPAKTVRQRLAEVDDNLSAAAQFLADRGVTEAADARGRVLFENTDIERCREFQRTLRDRFTKELAILDPDGVEAVRR